MKLPKSAKELRKLLLDYQSNAFNGNFFDPEGVAEKVAEATRSDPNAPRLAKLLGGLSLKDAGNGIMACMHYWNFRDEVQAYQVKNNISSVYWHTITWKGEIVRYPDLESQLLPLPQDLGIVAKHKDKVVGVYLDFCQRWNLSIETSNDGDYYLPVTQDYVRRTAKDYAWASLGVRENAPVRELKTNKVLHYFSQYSLMLHKDDEFCSGESRNFEARQEFSL